MTDPADAMSQGDGSSRPPSDSGVLPEWIGPYRILQKIGSGGMGAVYVAEQRGAVRRRVAVKVVRPGMESADVLARFDAERQALAMMEHPNIARVFDAGIDATGRPFFAMELVHGQELTDFCDARRLRVRARLDLFLAVCAGVAHAHQKGIIHRDLKPANVLVTMVDERPVPKIIDFGVAKAVAAPLTEQTLHTQAGAILGTFEYMSPEQADSGGLDIDTRSDVYSLGVMLYELLTGTRPLEATLLRDKGPRELLRLLREHAPPRPSTRVSTAGASASETARSREVDARGLVRRLRGELDWITMRAIEKERDRRYQSAQDLAADVRRFLRNEAVVAGPPSVAYRLRKVVRRHRAAFASAAIVLVALCVGLVVTLGAWREAEHQARMARRSEQDAIDERRRAVAAREVAETARATAATAQQRAEQEASRATEVVALIDEMLGLADPHRTRSPNYTLRELLERFGQGLGGRLARQPLVEATLRRTMGRAFLGVGLPDVARPHLERASALRAALLGDDAGPTLQSKLDLADLAHAVGDYVGAEKAAREALAGLERRGGAETDAMLLAAVTQLADYTRHQGDVEAAQHFGERALVETRRLRGADDGEVGMRLVDLGLIRELRGDHAGAERFYRQSIAVLTAAFGEHDPNTISAAGRLAGLLVARGAAAEAEPALRRYLDSERAAFGDDSNEVVAPTLTLGLALLARGEHQEAERMFRRACEVVDRHGGEGNINYASSHCQLGVALQAQQRWAESIPEFERVLAFLRRRFGDGHPEIATVAWNLGNSCIAAGRGAEAELNMRVAVEGFEALGATAMMARGLAGLVRARCATAPGRLCELLVAERARITAGAAVDAAQDSLCEIGDSVIAAARDLLATEPTLAAATLQAYVDALAPCRDESWTAVLDYQLGVARLAAADAEDAERAWRRGFAKIEGRRGRAELAREIARVLAELCERAGRAEDAARWRAKTTGR